MASYAENHFSPATLNLRHALANPQGAQLPGITCEELARISHQEKNPAVDNIERGPTPPLMAVLVAKVAVGVVGVGR
jgi:hypothetical protein